jgi:hypothetical protein
MTAIESAKILVEQKGSCTHPRNIECLYDNCIIRNLLDGGCKTHLFEIRLKEARKYIKEWKNDSIGDALKQADRAVKDIVRAREQENCYGDISALKKQYNKAKKKAAEQYNKAKKKAAEQEGFAVPENAVSVEEATQNVTAALKPEYNSIDAVNHPSHYAETVPGMECIDVTKHFNFCRGNAIKYIWRAGHKNDEIEDLKKAIKYIEFEISRIEKEVE